MDQMFQNEVQGVQELTPQINQNCSHSPHQLGFGVSGYGPEGWPTRWWSQRQSKQRVLENHPAQSVKGLKETIYLSLGLRDSL